MAKRTITLEFDEDFIAYLEDHATQHEFKGAEHYIETMTLWNLFWKLAESHDLQTPH